MLIHPINAHRVLELAYTWVLELAYAWVLELAYTWVLELAYAWVLELDGCAFMHGCLRLHT